MCLPCQEEGEEVEVVVEMAAISVAKVATGPENVQKEVEAVVDAGVVEEGMVASSVGRADTCPGIAHKEAEEEEVGNGDFKFL